MLGEQRFELAHLALGALAFEARVGQQRDAGRIVAAVFQRPQPGNQRTDHVAPRRGTDNSAHVAAPAFVRIRRRF